MPQQRPAYLIIRFSSIGDIVLTTPVIRSLKQAHPDSEVHFLTKKSFAGMLEANPFVDKVWALEDNFSTLVKQLRNQSFTHILDLHQNLRSWRLRLALRRPATGFYKANLAKWRMTRGLRPLPQLAHIVSRYGDTLKGVQTQLDEKGLDFFVAESARQEAEEVWKKWPYGSETLAVVLGATYSTKRWIPEYFVESLNQLKRPVLLLGGPDSRVEADILAEKLAVPFLDMVGKVSLMTSVALLDKCRLVISHDTGLMHIAAALGKKIISLWGNTVPEFGMTPYKTPHQILEVKDLDCRPCSKIGFDTCPKGHFRCMRDLKPDRLVEAVHRAD